MKLTVVTAVFNAIKSGNRENLIRCVRSVAALKTEHEHLIYDGASTDGTVELLRELVKKIGVENRWTADGLNLDSDAERIPRLRVVSEPDTGIYNALNKGVRDAKGEWFYVMGCDDYIFAPDVMEKIIETADSIAELIVSPVRPSDGRKSGQFSLKGKRNLLFGMPYCHQGVLMKAKLIRRFGGFDEQFKVCADYDLILAIHLDGCKVRFAENAFAEYCVNGLSSVTNLDEEIIGILKKRTGVVFERETSHYRFPVAKALCFLLHCDQCIRESARHALWLRAKPVLRMLLYPFVTITRPIRHGESK